MPQAPDLGGKEALVVGCATPAARPIALALAAAGADVAIASATTEPEEMFEARRIAKEAALTGRRTFSQGWDVTLPVNVQVGLKQLLKEFGRPSILVFTADAPLERPLEKTTDAEFARVQQVNLHGAFYAARSFVRECVPAGPGRIIFVTPALPQSSPPAGAAYAAARAGLVGLAAALSRELAPRAIAVHCVALQGDDPAATAALVALLASEAAAAAPPP
ncbi:MAG: SDR family NAD(P)-dependent oxidoreductase [Tepidiformaceae bacterium]